MMLASAGVDERGESPTHSASGRSLSLQSAGARQNGGTNERDSSMSPAALAAPAVAEQTRLEAKKRGRITSESALSPALATEGVKKSIIEKKEEGVSAFDRLYQASVQLRTKKLQKREEQQRYMEHSFHPVLATAGSRLAMKAPCTTPGQQSKKVAADYMYRDCTFEPDTCKTRAFTAKVMEKLTKNTPKKGSVVGRLYSSGQQQLAKQQKLEAERASQELRDCTFQPAIRGSTKASKEKAREGTESRLVYDRLHGFDTEIRNRHEMKRKESKAEELRECSFSPTLVTSSNNKPIDAAGTANDSGGEREVAMPIYERLYKLGMKGENQETIDTECTFHPRLSSRCPEVIRVKMANKDEKSGLSRLHSMYKTGREQQSRRCRSPGDTATRGQRDTDADMAFCTFQPDLSATARSRFKVDRQGTSVSEKLHTSRKSKPSVGCARQQRRRAA